MMKVVTLFRDDNIDILVEEALALLCGFQMTLDLGLNNILFGFDSQNFKLKASILGF